MDTASRELGQQQVTDDVDVLGGVGLASQAQPGRYLALVHDPLPRESQILRMVRHGHVERLGVVHGPSHKPGVHDRIPIVGDADGSGLHHLSDGG